MTKVNHKRFDLNTKIDFIYYLRFLIVAVDKRLRGLKQHLNELKRDMERLGVAEYSQRKIPAYVYERHNDALQYAPGYLLNLIGDHSESAASYKKFREIAERRISRGADWSLPKLSDEIKDAIKRLNNARNWGLHVPESLINAQIESAREVYGIDARAEALTNPELIKVNFFTYFNSEWLLSLYHSEMSNYEEFRNVYQQMKRDYSSLVGSSVRIEPVHHDLRPFEDEILIPQTSFLMQNRKFKN
ncbi:MULTISPECIES: hypothetical protein [unclassified Brevibacillus]|uniref:hypothetical protein n=1 Tax=unclassified Brevibacillus TaxID=2684853 RepID=UPI00356B05BD